jgi:hypothetical protein
MEWEKPSFIEVNMNSEIGGYQEDESIPRTPVPTDTVETLEGQRDMVQSRQDGMPVSAS